jgi:hypothetical protein
MKFLISLFLAALCAGCGGGSSAGAGLYADAAK